MALKIALKAYGHTFTEAYWWISHYFYDKNAGTMTARFTIHASEAAKKVDQAPPLPVERTYTVDLTKVRAAKSNDGSLPVDSATIASLYTCLKANEGELKDGADV